jgi:uncharacterized protein
MWIKREIEKIWTELESEYPIIVVTGSRQVGKTSLLEKIYGTANIVSLDLPRVAEAAEFSPETFLNGLKLPAVIDEIQYAPELFRPLKHFADKVLKPSGQKILLTGSERFSLMAGVSESLAGRAGIVELSSLSLKELENQTNLKASGNQLIEWLLQGGYPGLHSTGANRERFYSNLFSTYIERDVKRLINVQETRDFDRFLRICSLRTGQILSMNNIASDLGISQTTIKRWLGVLQASALVDIVEPWHENANKRLIKSPKLYFNDTGLSTFLAGLNTKEEILRSPLLGAFFETLCYNQLRKSFQNRAIQEKIYYFRTRDGVEIDFLIPRGTECLAFECKYSENPKADLKPIKILEDATNLTITSLCLLNSGREPYRVSKERDIFAVSVADAGLMKLENL